MDDLTSTELLSCRAPCKCCTTRWGSYTTCLVQADESGGQGGQAPEAPAPPPARRTCPVVCCPTSDSLELCLTSSPSCLSVSAVADGAVCSTCTGAWTIVYILISTFHSSASRTQAHTHASLKAKISSATTTTPHILSPRSHFPVTRSLSSPSHYPRRASRPTITIVASRVQITQHHNGGSDDDGRHLRPGHLPTGCRHRPSS